MAVRFNWKVKQGDVFVLTDYEQKELHDYFVVQLLTTSEIEVRNKLGEVFRSEDLHPIWVHQHVLIEFPEDRYSYINKVGKKVIMRFSINDGRKLHLLTFTKDKLPHLFEKLPPYIQGV